MAKDNSYSTVKHGMNKSDHIDFIKSHEYTHAKNATLFNLQEGGIMLQNEASNLLTVDFGDFKVIGVRNIYSINKSIYFLYNPKNNVSKISLVSNTEIGDNKYDEIKECADCKTVSILDTPLEDIKQTPDREEEIVIEDECNKCLNFSLEYPVKFIVVKEEATGIKVYFTDYNNEQRVVDLELARKGWYVDNTVESCGEVVEEGEDCLDCEKIRLHPQYSPIVAKAKSVQGGGDLKRGTYQTYMAYVNDKGLEISEYQYVTQPVTVFDSHNTSLTDREIIEEKTNISIKIDIESIDEKMDYYKVIVVKRNKEGFKIYEEGIFNTRNKEVVLYTEEGKPLFDRSDLFLKIPTIKRSEIMAESGNMLIQANVETQPDWNLQPVVNFMGSLSYWMTVEATEQFYADGVNSANSKTALRDETYAKALRFFTNTGYISPLYPLIARPAYEDEIEEKDKNSNEYKSVQQNVNTCSLTGRELVWQYENTAENLGRVEEYEGSGIVVRRDKDFYCRVEGIGAFDEDQERVVNISLNEFDNYTFSGLISFINTNKEAIETYQGRDEGMLDLKEVLTKNYGRQCTPTVTVSDVGCEIPEDWGDILKDQTVVISGVKEEKERFIETSFPIGYSRSTPPKYANLYFINNEGEEEEDITFRDTFLHHGVGNWNFYRDSMRKNWQLPRREIHTNNFSCLESDTLPHYETSVRGEDQAYLMDYQVEQGEEEQETASGQGEAKAKVTEGSGTEELRNFTVFKSEKVGDRTTFEFKVSDVNIVISVEGDLSSGTVTKTLNSDGPEGNYARYYRNNEGAYSTGVSGSSGQIQVTSIDQDAGEISGTFSFTAKRESLDGTGVEEVTVQEGEFTEISYRESQEGDDRDSEYPAGLEVLIDTEKRIESGGNKEDEVKSYKLKTSYRKGKIFKPYGDVFFYKGLHTKPLWFKVNIPEDKDFIVEMTKTSDKTCEMRNGKQDFVGAVSLNMFRVSFWETCSSEKPFYTEIINERRDENGDVITDGLDPESPANRGFMKRFVTSKERAKFLIEESELAESDVRSYIIPLPGSPTDEVEEIDNLLEGKSQFYMTVEAPIFRTHAEPKYMLAPSCQSFSVTTRAIEYGEVEVKFKNIEIDITERYGTVCDIELPNPEDCSPQNYEYGEFSYVESTNTYPDNQELYNSKNLAIEPLDFKNPEDRQRFEGIFSNGVDTEGKYRLSEEANFSCKNIRHFKYPDNEHAPFIQDKVMPGFSDSAIYPLAFTINETTVKDFLDIAVKNSLITKKERESIVGYEVFQGSRKGNESIQAKGILFDSYNYKVKDKTVDFANFPYNDLGENRIFLDEDKSPIQHPYNGDKNNKFMMMSPDLYNKGGVWADEMVVDSFQYGESVTSFPEVKEHPKWVILGKKAYSTANLLAWTETTLDITLQLLEGIEAFRVSFGLSSGFNIPGVILHVAATALALTQNIFVKRGSYKLQWLQTIRDLGTPYNFAHRAAGVGKYNHLSANRSIVIPDNKLRGLTSREMLGEGLITTTDKLGNISHVNNVDREKSMFLTLGEYDLVYPEEYSTYDNNKISFGNSSRFTLGEVDMKGGPDLEVTRNIASPYVTLKNYVPSQYGEIGSVKWLPTSYYGDLTKEPETKEVGGEEVEIRPTIFAGDSFIGRFYEIRKIPMYLVDAMGQSSLTTFAYNKERNIGDSTKYYVDYEVSGEERLRSLIIPEIKSDYNLDCETGKEGFYLKPPSKFYLQYYGIAGYMVESSINTNLRYSREGLHNSFFPQVKDYVRLTEETLRPIKTPNTLYYDRSFGSDPIRMATNVLLNNYESEVEAKKAKGEGLMIQSEVDLDEFSSTDPWTIYKPNNMYKAPTSAGKLVGLDGVESNQVIARFHRGFSVINAVDTMQRMTNKDRVYGTGGIFAARPMEFHNSELGYAGSQNYKLVKTEFGHAWVDAEAGQVFLAVIGGNGMPNLQEISSRYGEEDTKMSMWFKNHLPFKILKSGLPVDIDNNYNGIGVAMEYDSRFKRLLITKRDYILKNKDLEYRDKNFRLTEGPEVDAIIGRRESEGWTYEGIEDSRLKFSKEEEGTQEDCLRSLKFIVAYREIDNAEGDPNPPACGRGHICDRAVFNITGNDIFLGQVSINNSRGVDNSGEPYDWGNRFPDYVPVGQPGYPGYVGQHERDRYNEFTLNSVQAMMLANSSQDGTVTFKFLCACETGINCSHSNCHGDISWLRIVKDGEEIYNGCPDGNILEDFVPCVKTDYEILKEEYEDLPIVEINENDFEDVSWTIAFYFQYGRWGSFYDFKPNYYVPQKNYLQSGINTDQENTMWSHHLTKRSYQVFYGKRYDWEVEFPIETKGNNRYLEDVQYRLDAIRYQDNFDYYQNEEISFDEAVIYNNTANSGKMKLVNRKTIAQERRYPKRVNNVTQKILQTNKEGIWSFNYFYNRVKDLRSRLPLWRYDENQIDKEVNSQAISMYGKRQLDRMRGQNFLINLKSKETQHQKAIKIVKTKENLYR